MEGTIEELNAMVYQKLFDEQQIFEKWWLAQPKHIIRRNAHRYVIQQDILLAVEEQIDLDEEQCKVILGAEEPLRAMYNEFVGYETDHMDYVRSAIEDAVSTVAYDSQLREMGVVT